MDKKKTIQEAVKTIQEVEKVVQEAEKAVQEMEKEYQNVVQSYRNRLIINEDMQEKRKQALLDKLDIHLKGKEIILENIK